MRRVVQRRRFRNDLKRLKRRGRDLEELFAVVDLLAELGSLPDAYRPHSLTGEWKGVLECHVDRDWLLIYAVSDDQVLLIRTGTHADLFE
jgi:mRNA interferase YafQ